MTVMVRTLAIMAASSWLSLVGGTGAAAEPPASTETPSESAEPRTTTADLPAATADPAVAAELPPAATIEAAADPEADQLQPIKEITLDPTAKPPVCRRYVPTGSRIATERCQSAEVTDAMRAAERDQARRDIDEMRMRQATRDAARAAAQAESLRRSAGF
jgi:hypothetical protein